VAVTVRLLRAPGGGGGAMPLALGAGGGGGGATGLLGSAADSSSGTFPLMRYLLRTGSHLISSSGS
jgi:hypothetical protein